MLRLNLLSLLFLLFFAGAQAQAKTEIYCKSSEGPFVCAEALSDGSACFTGSGNQLVLEMNRDTYSGEGQWIEGAALVTKDEISYIYVNAADEVRERLVLERCLGDDEFEEFR